LSKRCVNDEVRDKLLGYIQGMEDACARMGESIVGANPSPGNIEGGLTTIEEKSLGCVYKAGSTVIQEAIGFADVPTKKGLIVMDTPGHDIESMTALAAAGAQVCIFSTGRGTPMGSAVMPTIKLCANARTCENMKDNIDVNLSTVMERKETPDEAAQRVLNEIYDVINGKLTSSEQRGMFAFGINRIGPTM